MTTAVSTLDRTADSSLLRADEVAALLRVTPRTVRRWGAAGVIDQIRLGDRLTRYTRESVEVLLHPTTREAPAGNQGFSKTAGAGDGYARRE